MENQDLNTIYEKCYDGYQKVDEIRFNLLRFFPLSSGLTILGSLYIVDKNNQSIIIPYHCELGFFGLIVSIGLLIYELKGIEKCTQFIYLGAWIETKMKENIVQKEPTGYFTQLLKGNSIITEPLASAFIYSIVLALWTYVMELTDSDRYKLSILAFVLSFISVILYWHFQCVKKNSTRFDIPPAKNK